MWLELSFGFLGGLGIFFFGMKTLSDAFQSIAGDFIQRIINTLTSNRFLAIGVGALVTTIVQSSSVTTVMVVALVNANLMQLTQAIGVIFGANIGTTITGWIIAIKVGKYGPLFVGIGIFPYMFAKKEDWKAVGRLLIALGFIFMGLKMMGSAFKPLRSHEGFMEMLVYFSANGYLSLLACVAMGALLTCLIQSSSAMLGITIALATTGTITFQTAAALVMGENIGTTITALLASVGTNSHAKRAARAHALFNGLGVLWLSPLFWQYTKLIDFLVPGNPNAEVAGSFPYIAAHIASGHTLFNLVNTLFFIPLIKPLARFVTWVTPSPQEKEVAHLQYLNTGVGRSPALSIVAAQRELANLSKISQKAFSLTKKYLSAPVSDEKIAERILKYEQITDSIQAEITQFLCRAQEGRMTADESNTVYGIIRAADELESIADYCVALVRYAKRINKSAELTDDEKDEIKQFTKDVYSFFRSVQSKVGALSSDYNISEIHDVSKKISDQAKSIAISHRKRLEAGVGSPAASMLFSDCISALRKIRGHVVNVAEALSGQPLTDQPV